MCYAPLLSSFYWEDFCVFVYFGWIIFFLLCAIRSHNSRMLELFKLIPNRRHIVIWLAAQFSIIFFLFLLGNVCHTQHIRFVGLSFNCCSFMDFYNNINIIVLEKVNGTTEVPMGIKTKFICINIRNSIDKYLFSFFGQIDHHRQPFNIPYWNVFFCYYSRFSKGVFGLRKKNKSH